MDPPPHRFTPRAGIFHLRRMLGPTNGLSRHSYASGTFAAASHLMISTLEHGPPPHRSTPRAGPASSSPTLGPTNALSRHSYASGIFAATSRNYDQYASQTLARARIRRSAGSHHGPGLHLPRHTSTGQGHRALPRHCHASRISPPGYAHGQDGTTTHRHTPWAGARTLLLATRKCQVQLPSRTLMSSTQATSQWRARPRPAPLRHGGQGRDRYLLYWRPDY